MPATLPILILTQLDFELTRFDFELTQFNSELTQFDFGLTQSDFVEINLIPGIDPETGRTPEIVADAAYAILTRDSKTCTGNFFIDEEVLVEEGVTDFEKYSVNPDKTLTTDLYLD